MGLFKLFVPKADPLAVWKAEPGLVTNLDFDFDHHTLCGIKPGDPVSLLWKLGPPEDKTAEKKGDYNYYSRGVQVSAENGLIVSIILFWNDKLQKLYQTFNGSSNYHNQVITLRGELNEMEIKGVFGEPYWRNEDADEIILFYEFGDIEWEIEIDRHEGLTAIVVMTPPLLSEESQRKAYQVTKPWPPPLPTVI
jgi:hypothetical protein